MSRTIHVKHVASGNMFLWLHKNSSSPRDTTFFSVVDEGSGLMYPCYFSLEPANPLEYLSLILSTYLGTWWIDHLGDTYGHLYNRTVWRSWRRVRSPFLDHEFRVPCWSHRLEHPVLADQQILILAQVDSGWKHFTMITTCTCQNSHICTCGSTWGTTDTTEAAGDWRAD